MYKLGLAVIWCVNMIECAVIAISPYWRALCFFRDWNSLRIPGQCEWNDLIFDDLMIEYGYWGIGDHK